MYSVLFLSLFCSAVLRKWLILVVFGVLLVVFARDVWENLGKWNKMGVLCVLELSPWCGAAGAAVWCFCWWLAPLGIGAFWRIGLFSPPPFFAFSEKIFEFISGLFCELLWSELESERKIFCSLGLTV